VTTPERTTAAAFLIKIPPTREFTVTLLLSTLAGQPLRSESRNFLRFRSTVGQDCDAKPRNSTQRTANAESPYT
jgi:hypothetical protein